jgi:hypothetical protein
MARLELSRKSTLGGMFGFGALVGITLSGPLTAGAQRTEPPAVQAGAVETLIAKDQIRDQIYNYCRGLDRMDRELALSVWHSDAVVETGGNKLTGPQWIESAWRAHEKISAHTHQMTNILIKMHGDTATSETYFHTSLRGEPTPESSTTRSIRGRYLDRWSKRSGRWAMDYRRIIVDFSTGDEEATRNPPLGGRRDKTDPSYAVYN